MTDLRAANRDSLSRKSLWKDLGLRSVVSVVHEGNLLLSIAMQGSCGTCLRREATVEARPKGDAGDGVQWSDAVAVRLSLRPSSQGFPRTSQAIASQIDKQASRLASGESKRRKLAVGYLLGPQPKLALSAETEATQDVPDPSSRRLDPSES